MNGFVRARVDESLKDAASVVLEAVGLSVSDVIRVVLTRIAKDGAIPVGLFTPNETTIAAMRESRLIMKSKSRFKVPEEMFGELEGKTKSNKE